MKAGSRQSLLLFKLARPSAFAKRVFAEMAALESPPNRIEYNEAFNSNRTTLGSYDSYNSSNSLLCVDISISSVEGGASLNASSNTTDEKKKDASVMVHEVLPPYQDILAPDTASLPREQRDWGAIKFMAGSIIIESIIWGFPTLFGVFGRYYTTTSKFSGDTRIAIIGTVSLVSNVLSRHIFVMV